MTAIITQLRTGGRVPSVDRPNHCILVDNSCGSGSLPDEWSMPNVRCRVGFAGGLRPENLAEQLSRIVAAGAADAWICMESGLRDTDDWFDVDRARSALSVFRSFCTERPKPRNRDILER